MSDRQARIEASVLAGALAALPLFACGSVDARGDLQETSRLVGERTGRPDTWDPETSEEILRADLEAMLEDGLTIDEAVRVALVWNPALRSGYRDVGIRKAELVAAGLPRNPFLLVSTRFPEGGGRVNVTASVSQSLLDLFLIPARRRAGEARLSMARWQVVREAVQLAGRVEGEVFDRIALRRGRAVAEEGLALARRSREIARRRQHAGLGDAVDVSLADNAVLAARRELLVIDRDLALSRAALGELLGLPPGSGEWRLADELAPPLPPEEPLNLVETALERRLDVEVARLRVAAARGDLDVEETRRLPDLALGFERERAESPPTLSGPVLEGSLPLWSRNGPAVARQSFLVEKAQDELRRTRDAVEREVREALARLGGARSELALFESEILPRASASAEIARRAWQAGERDVLVALEAQRFLLEQRRAYVAALRDAGRARAALEVAIGGPGSGEGQTGPKEQGEP